jgi:hypothetical protein
MEQTATDPQLESLRRRWPGWHIRAKWTQSGSGPGACQWIATAPGQRLCAFDPHMLEESLSKTGVK